MHWFSFYSYAILHNTRNLAMRIQLQLYENDMRCKPHLLNYSEHFSRINHFFLAKKENFRMLKKYIER